MRVDITFRRFCTKVTSFIIFHLESSKCNEQLKLNTFIALYGLDKDVTKCYSRYNIDPSGHGNTQEKQMLFLYMTYITILFYFLTISSSSNRNPHYVKISTKTDEDEIAANRQMERETRIQQILSIGLGSGSIVTFSISHVFLKE